MGICIIKLSIFICMVTATFLVCIGCSCADAGLQTFDTDLGKIQIDIPIAVRTAEHSSGSSLRLVPAAIYINLQDIQIFQCKNLSCLVNVFMFEVGLEQKSVDTFTNDNHRMLFYTESSGLDFYQNSVYSYYAFIDYIKDNGRVIEISGQSEAVSDGDIVATFNEDEFQNICKSFAFVK